MSDFKQYNNNLTALKVAHRTSVLKKFPKIRKKTIDLLIFCLISQKFMKDVCVTKFQITLESFSSNFNAAFDRDSVRKQEVRKITLCQNRL